MQPLLDAPPPVQSYAPGSWGPEEADELLSPGYGALARAVDRVMSTDAARPGGPAERRRAVAVPADRGLRVPVRLPHRRARRAGRGDRLALRPVLRLAERLRQPARPPGGLLPLRAVRDQPSDRAALRARHERPRDDLEDARPAGCVVRDALTIGPADHEDEITPTPGRRRTTTPTTCSCGRSSASRARSRSSSSASRRSTTAGQPAEWTMVDGDRHTADATGAGPDHPAAVRPRARHRGRPRARPARRSRPASSAYCALSWAEGLAAPADVEEAEARIAATTGSGAAGSARARIPDHRCATRSSARRSRSRA